MDLELATNELERELLEFPLSPVENENSAINLHSVYIGRSDSEQKAKEARGRTAGLFQSSVAVVSDSISFGSGSG